jgi:hypothetical protein
MWERDFKENRSNMYDAICYKIFKARNQQAQIRFNRVIQNF